MHFARIQQPSRSRGGVALVEFAIVFPIVLLVFAGMIEISRILLLQHSADTAAYEGARSAMVPGATAAEASQASQTLLRAVGLKSFAVTVSPTEIQEDTPLITVRVEIPIQSNAWITPHWFQNSRVVSETTLFCERPPMVQMTGIPQIKALATALKSKRGNSGGSGSGNSNGSGTSTSSGTSSGSTDPNVSTSSSGAVSASN